MLKRLKQVKGLLSIIYCNLILNLRYSKKKRFNNKYIKYNWNPSQLVIKYSQLIRKNIKIFAQRCIEILMNKKDLIKDQIKKNYKKILITYAKKRTLDVITGGIYLTLTLSYRIIIYFICFLGWFFSKLEKMVLFIEESIITFLLIKLVNESPELSFVITLPIQKALNDATIAAAKNTSYYSNMGSSLTKFGTSLRKGTLEREFFIEGGAKLERMATSSPNSISASSNVYYSPNETRLENRGLRVFYTTMSPDSEGRLRPNYYTTPIGMSQSSAENLRAAFHIQGGTPQSHMTVNLFSHDQAVLGANLPIFNSSALGGSQSVFVKLQTSKGYDSKVIADKPILDPAKKSRSGKSIEQELSSGKSIEQGSSSGKSLEQRAAIGHCQVPPSSYLDPNYESLHSLNQRFQQGNLDTNSLIRPMETAFRNEFIFFESLSKYPMEEKLKIAGRLILNAFIKPEHSGLVFKGEPVSIVLSYLTDSDHIESGKEPGFPPGVGPGIGFPPRRSFSTKSKRFGGRKIVRKKQNEIIVFSKNKERIDQKEALNKKAYYQIIDNMVDQLLENGFISFFVTVNIPYNGETVSGYKFGQKDLIEKGIFKVLLELDTLVFFIMSKEFHADGRPHLHFILLFPNLIGSSFSLKTNIIQKFSSYFVDIDIKLTQSPLDTKKTWKYVTKSLFEHDRKSKDFDKRVFVRFYFNKYYNFWYERSDIYLKLQEYVSWIFRPEFIDFIKFNNRIFENSQLFINENSPLLKDLSYGNITMLYNLFFNENNIVVSGNKLYQCYKKSFIGIYEIGIVQDIDLLFDSLIKPFCIEKYPLRFKNFPFLNLKMQFLKKFKIDFENYPSSFVSSVELNWNYMEFRDGIYEISTDTFYPHIKNPVLLEEPIGENDEGLSVQNLFHNKFFEKSLKKTNIKTLLFYDVTYKYINRKENLIWLNMLSQRLKISKESRTLQEEIMRFLTSFSKFFNREILNVVGKGNLATVIDGPSNSLKTTLIGSVLKNFYKMDNIGTISSSKEFAYEDIIDKQIIFVNEFNLDLKNINDLLEVLSGDGSRKFNRKYKTAKALDLKMAVALITMDWKKQMDFLEKQSPEVKIALENRVTVFNMLPMTPEISGPQYLEIIKQINEEVPRILILCNRVARHFYGLDRKKSGDSSNGSNALRKKFPKLEKKILLL